MNIEAHLKTNEHISESQFLEQISLQDEKDMLEIELHKLKGAPEDEIEIGWWDEELKAYEKVGGNFLGK